MCPIPKPARSSTDTTLYSRRPPRRVGAPRNPALARVHAWRMSPAEVLQQLVGRQLLILVLDDVAVGVEADRAAAIPLIRAVGRRRVEDARASICRRHLRQRSRYANDASAQSTRYA